MIGFREIIDAFGIARTAVLFGVSQSHVRTMKARGVIPPQYWRKILDTPKPEGLPTLTLPMLDDLYTASREKEREAAE